MQHQRHYGKKFYLDKTTGYWISTTHPRIRAHVWVWESVNGEIPNKYQVHHKDRNKSNNDIDNLCLLSAKDHVREHLTEEKKEWSRKWINEIRPLTKEWHKSKEGKEWHRIHGKEVWEKRKPFIINCLFCKKDILTKTFHQKFCHQNCKAKYGRRIKKDKKHSEVG